MKLSFTTPHFKKHLILLFLLSQTLLSFLHAQDNSKNDSIVQVYGVVMTNDSLFLLPNVNIHIVGSNRGTVSNHQGVFSIVAYKGDTLKFTYAGLKPSFLYIPTNLSGKQFSAIEVLSRDTITLPVAIIKPRPTREQFERDFITFKDVNASMIQQAKSNSQSLDRAIINSMIAKDATQTQNQNFRNNINDATKTGVPTSLNVLDVFNPSAWRDFIKSWKSGEYK